METADFKTYDTDRVQQAVDQFVAHLNDELPDGHPSDLGGEVPGLLNEDSEIEYHRLVAVGEAVVDAYVRDHPSKT